MALTLRVVRQRQCEQGVFTVKWNAMLHCGSQENGSVYAQGLPIDSSIGGITMLPMNARKDVWDTKRPNYSWKLAGYSNNVGLPRAETRDGEDWTVSCSRHGTLCLYCLLVPLP